AVAAIVDVRELRERPLGQLHAQARRPPGSPVEVAAERGRAVTLVNKLTRLADREERREGEHFVVDGQPVADRPAAPGDLRAEGVVAAEGGGAGGDVEVRLPLQVDADRAELLSDPRVQRGE